MVNFQKAAGYQFPVIDATNTVYATVSEILNDPFVHDGHSTFTEETVEYGSVVFTTYVRKHNGQLKTLGFGATSAESEDVALRYLLGTGAVIIDDAGSCRQVIAENVDDEDCVKQFTHKLQLIETAAGIANLEDWEV